MTDMIVSVAMAVTVAAPLSRPLPMAILSTAGFTMIEWRMGGPPVWKPKLFTRRAEPELTPNRRKYGSFRLKSSTPTLLPTMFLANLWRENSRYGGGKS